MHSVHHSVCGPPRVDRGKLLENVHSLSALRVIVSCVDGLVVRLEPLHSGALVLYYSVVGPSPSRVGDAGLRRFDSTR